MPHRRGLAHLRTLGLILAAVALGLLVATQVLPWFLGHGFSGTEFPDPSPAPSLDGLLTSSGEPADLSDHEGEVVLVYFGYLSCPDVCPVTLATVGQAIEQLGPDGERVKVLMVSVDPARDSPADVESYLEAFTGEFEGLHGVEPALGEVASRWGIFYELEQPDPEGNYAVGHTASLMGVDADGNLRVLWPFGTTADQLAADIRRMM